MVHHKRMLKSPPRASWLILKWLSTWPINGILRIKWSTCTPCLAIFFEGYPLKFRHYIGLRPWHLPKNRCLKRPLIFDLLANNVVVICTSYTLVTLCTSYITLLNETRWYTNDSQQSSLGSHGVLPQKGPRRTPLGPWQDGSTTRRRGVNQRKMERGSVSRRFDDARLLDRMSRKTPVLKVWNDGKWWSARIINWVWFPCGYILLESLLLYLSCIGRLRPRYHLEKEHHVVWGRQGSAMLTGSDPERWNAGWKISRFVYRLRNPQINRKHSQVTQLAGQHLLIWCLCNLPVSLSAFLIGCCWIRSMSPTPSKLLMPLFLARSILAICRLALGHCDFGFWQQERLFWVGKHPILLY